MGLPIWSVFCWTSQYLWSWLPTPRESFWMSLLTFPRSVTERSCIFFHLAHAPIRFSSPVFHSCPFFMCGISHICFCMFVFGVDVLNPGLFNISGTATGEVQASKRSLWIVVTRHEELSATKQFRLGSQIIDIE